MRSLRSPMLLLFVAGIGLAVLAVIADPGPTQTSDRGDLIFSDDFESAGLDAWSSSSPSGFAFFQSTVQPLLAEQCGSCHLGERFSFASLFQSGATFTAEETLQNYDTFRVMVSLDNPEHSRLLGKILPSTDPASQEHGGGALVTGTSDPIYQSLLQWIEVEKMERCRDCGTTSTRAYIAYVDQPDHFWAVNRTPRDDRYGLRTGARIMMQPVDPSSGQPLPGSEPFAFLPESFCGPDQECDFGHSTASWAGDRLVFECRMAPDGGDYLLASWNLCIAEIGAGGRAVNPRHLMPEEQRHYGWSVSRRDPWMLWGEDGLPLRGIWDIHARMRKKGDYFPIFTPDDQRIVTASRSPDPRTGVSGTRTYHGSEHTENIISVSLDGLDRRTLYRSEGGSADRPSYLRNGNVVFHTWNLDRMDRHLYTQATADGMMELPVLFGRIQGENMWGDLVQAVGGDLLGITGRRRGSVNLFQAFFADHTLGTGIDPEFTSFGVLDPAIESEMAPTFSYCNNPPDGPNCSTARFYGDMSWEPTGGALIAYHPERTYYKAHDENDQIFQDYYGSRIRQDWEGLQPWLPEMTIAKIDRLGAVTVLLTPAEDRSFRYPTWVGRRESPPVQAVVTDESQSSAELHIADFPLWLSMRINDGQSKAGRMAALDEIVAVRVLTKGMQDGACLADSLPYRKSTYRGTWGGPVDHPTLLGIVNATGFTHHRIPPALGGDGYGNVTLQTDRSVRLRLPAGELLLLQGIDAEGHLVAQHSRVFTLPPGHTVDTSVRRSQYYPQCSSCHGSVDATPYVGLAGLGTLPEGMDFKTEAASSPAVDTLAGSVETRRLTFLHALRPLLDAHCVSCHSGASPEGELTLESTYSQTANYPAGRWAQPAHTVSAYLDFVPESERVPAYNWSVARSYMLEDAAQIEAFIPADDPYLPQGDLAPWDPGYQALAITDPTDTNRFLYLSDYPYGAHLGRGGRFSDTSFLLEVLTGNDLSQRHDFSGTPEEQAAHTSLLTEEEIRLLMAVIDNGMPFMATCADKIIPSGPNAGQPWGQPVETDWSPPPK